jgi:drug/metabolite transporter (DMT)-like permease
MELEKLVIQDDSKRATKAQRNSFIITISILLLAAVLFYLGKDGPAIAAVFTALAPIIIAFITGSISRKKERENKRKDLGV